MATKKVCPVTKDRFISKATNLLGKDVLSDTILQPKAFSTGSYGFHASGKKLVMVDGVPVEHQMNITLTAIGSKPGE